MKNCGLKSKTLLGQELITQGIMMENSDDDLRLKKTLEFRNMLVAVRSVFHEDNKYYPQAFLGERLYKLQMLNFDRIDVSEGIDVNKTSESKIIMFFTIVLRF